MKKFVSLALSAAILAAAFTLPALAAAQEGSNSKSVTATVAGISSKAPKLDGVVGKDEYKEIPFTTDDLRISGTTNERLASNVELAKTLKLYASYSKDTMYVAVVVNTPEYVQTMESSDMWQQHSLQIGAAKGDESVVTNRSEMGFARRSDDNKLIFKLWTDAYNTGWAADTTGKDFVCVTKDGVTTYEIAIPAKMFGVESLKKGDKVRLNLCLNIATSSADRGAIECSQGTATGKNATYHALVTLGNAIVATNTGSSIAPQTADASALILLAVVSSLSAAYVIRKHR